MVRDVQVDNDAAAEKSNFHSKERCIDLFRVRCPQRSKEQQLTQVAKLPVDYGRNADASDDACSGFVAAAVQRCTNKKYSGKYVCHS